MKIFSYLQEKTIFLPDGLFIAVKNNCSEVFQDVQMIKILSACTILIVPKCLFYIE